MLGRSYSDGRHSLPSCPRCTLELFECRSQRVGQFYLERVRDGERGTRRRTRDTCIVNNYKGRPPSHFAADTVVVNVACVELDEHISDD